MIQKIEGTPPMFPNQCARCLLTHNEEIIYFIDTGISYDYPAGVVYICNRCLKAFVDVSGDYITQEDSDAAVEASRADVSEKLIRLEACEEALHVVSRTTGLTIEQLIYLGQLNESLAAKEVYFDELNGKVQEKVLELENVVASVELSKTALDYTEERIQARARELDLILRPAEEVFQDGYGRASEDAHSEPELDFESAVEGTGSGREEPTGSGEPSDDIHPLQVNFSIPRGSD